MLEDPEAREFTRMLADMYLKWASERRMKVETLEGFDLITAEDA